MDPEDLEASPSLKKAPKCVTSNVGTKDCEKTVQKQPQKLESEYINSPPSFTGQALESNDDQDLEAKEELFVGDDDGKHLILTEDEKTDEHFIDIPVDMQYVASTDASKYTPNPNYLREKQPKMTWIMSAILMDWMMEVCNEHSLKRPTFYLAVNYLDRFLSVSYDFPKSKLQLLGLVSLFMAAKMEEIITPKLSELASLGYDYSLKEILDLEQELFKTLGFQLNPAGVHFWTEWFTFNWDMIIEEKAGVPDSNLMELELVQFKQMDETSYKIFRELYQLIDCAFLEYEILKFDMKLVILSFISLLLWSHLVKINSKEVATRYMEVMEEDGKGVNRLMMEFVRRADGVRLEALRETLPFCARFFELEMDYDYPMVTRVKAEEVMEVNLIYFFY